MAEHIASEGPVRVRVSNKWIPARPHSARRWGAKAFPACAFVALIAAAGLFSNVWLPKKWSVTDLHAVLDPLTTQDTNTNPDTSLTAPQYAAEGGHPIRSAQDTKTNLNTSFTALQYDAAGGDPVAEWKLGRMYAAGDGVIQDDLRAFEYFSRIANAHAEDSCVYENPIRVYRMIESAKLAR
jgi:TPR repeat protein